MTGLRFRIIKEECWPMIPCYTNKVIFVFFLKGFPKTPCEAVRIVRAIQLTQR
jgi:hypothetical protein